jgi:hypothetical protein
MRDAHAAELNRQARWSRRVDYRLIVVGASPSK